MTRGRRPTTEGGAWKAAFVLSIIILCAFCAGSPPNLNFARVTGFGSALTK